jgi:hypothetical protein
MALEAKPMKKQIPYIKEYRALSGVYYFFTKTPYYAIEPKTAIGRWMIFSTNPDLTFHTMVPFFEDVTQYVEDHMTTFRCYAATMEERFPQLRAMTHSQYEFVKRLGI